MVYTSLPAYMDPANWQQQQPNHQGGSNTGASTPLILPSPPPPPPSSQPHGGSIRPVSTADKARMNNMPMQEAPLKCPRCESTNTKFCYYNNYNLSQPRHFCKTCRRYWTRGGALRNVPVGGGCRRNKRTKSTTASSSSSSKSDRQTVTTAAAASAADMAAPLQPPPRFTAPLHQLGDHHLGEIGLNYGLISGPMGGVGELNFQMGNALGGLEQWRMPQTHQFPFLSGLEASSSHGLLYPFEGGGGGTTQVSTSQLASVKMEDNYHHGLGLSRQFLGINNNSSSSSNNNNNNNHNPTSEQYWSASGGATSAWTDLSAFNSTSNPL